MIVVFLMKKGHKNLIIIMIIIIIIITITIIIKMIKIIMIITITKIQRKKTSHKAIKTPERHH